jgi:hypothetical protein
MNLGGGFGAGVDMSSMVNPIADLAQDVTDIMAGMGSMQTGITGGVNVGILGQEAGSDLASMY